MGIWDGKGINNTGLPGSWRKNKTKPKSDNKALNKRRVAGPLLPTCRFFHFPSYPSPTLSLGVERGRGKTVSLGTMKKDDVIW